MSVFADGDVAVKTVRKICGFSATESFLLLILCHETLHARRSSDSTAAWAWQDLEVLHDIMCAAHDLGNCCVLRRLGCIRKPVAVLGNLFRDLLAGVRVVCTVEDPVVVGAA